jgi:hypothetical protein
VAQKRMSFYELVYTVMQVALDAACMAGGMV